MQAKTQHEVGSQPRPPTPQVPGVHGLEPLDADAGPGESLAFAGVWSATGQRVCVKLAADTVHASLEQAFELLVDNAHTALPAPLALSQDHAGRRCLVSAWVQGQTLAQGELPDSLLGVSGIIDLARGLSEIHRRGLWHGDLSPANAVLRPDGSMSWIDFGLLGQRGCGTPGFLAPESLQGQGGPASDVFAFACLIFWLWCGELVFADFAALAAYGRGQEDALATRLTHPKLPSQLRAVLASMLVADPSERPGIADVIVELELAKTAMFEQERPSAGWKLPSRVPYIGSGLQALTNAWTSLVADPTNTGPQLLVLSGAKGAGRRRSLEEFAMKLQASGHFVTQLAVPGPRLCARVITQHWLSQGDPKHTLVVTGVTWDEFHQELKQAKGLGIEQLMQAAIGVLVIAHDRTDKLSPELHASTVELAPLSGPEIDQAVYTFWPSQAAHEPWAQTQRRAWASWLQERFEGQAGATIGELFAICRHKALNPARWQLRALEDPTTLPAADKAWTLATLVAADHGEVLSSTQEIWQSFPTRDQLALALAFDERGWELSPDCARVLLGALLAQGLHDRVQHWCQTPALASKVGAMFIHARSLQARGQLAQSQALIQSLCQHQAPAAQCVGHALALRAKIDRGEDGILAYVEKIRPIAAKAPSWAAAWWRLWEGYAQLASDPNSAKTALKNLGLHCADLCLLERAPVLARASQLLGNHAWEQGQRSQAFAHYDESMRWFQAGGEAVGEALACGNVAALSLAGGELSRALEHGERALCGLLAHGAWQPLGALLTNHLQLLSLLGREERARTLIDLCRPRLQAQSLDAARVQLAAAFFGQGPIGAEEVEAMAQIEQQASAREALDTRVRLCLVVSTRGPASLAQSLAEPLPELARGDSTQLGLWARLVHAKVFGAVLDRGMLASAQRHWGHIAQSDAPLSTLSWVPLFLALQDGATLPRFARDSSGHKVLLDRVLAQAPFAARAALRERWSLPSPASTPAPAPERVAVRAGDQSVDSLLRRFERLTKVVGLEQLRSAILEDVLDWTGAERGMLVLRDQEQQSVVAREFGSKTQGLATSRTIVESVFSSGSSVLTVDAQTDHRFGHAPSVAHLDLRSVLAAPMRDHTGVFGVIYLDARMRRGAFGEAQLVELERYARLATLAWVQARRLCSLDDRVQRLAQNLEQANAALQKQTLEGQRLRETQRNAQPTMGLSASYGLVGQSEGMRQVLHLVERFARATAPVVVVGEQGSGKRSVVRALHAAAGLEGAPLMMESLSLVPVNLQRELLWGHPGGRPSLFSLAEGGILYLEDIAALDLALQKELLALLEQDPGGLSCRLVCGSQEPLPGLVERGLLREDLCYRISVLQIEVPALRRRLEDLPLLVRHWLSKHQRPELEWSAQAMRALSRYAWPGNLRELAQEVERLAVMCQHRIEIDDLSSWVVSAQRSGGHDPDDLRIKPRVEALEKDMIARALERTQGNQSQAANLLGLSRYGLQKKLRRWSQETTPDE